MKYIILTVLVGWCILVQAQPIVEIEYFYDTDPGIGNGTALTITAGDTLDFISGGLSTSSLTSGFHTLYLRTKDSLGQWSLYTGRSFYIQSAPSNTPTPNISEIEYFYDSDPGAGNGNQLTITPADTIDTVFSGLSTANLTPGFHTLFTRAKGADGTWGLFTGRSVYIQSTQNTQPSPPLTRAEYFYDSDPGVGNGTSLSFAPGDIIDSVFPGLSTAGLLPGFHILFIRFFDDNGSWSLFEGRNFYIQESGPQDTVPLIGMEAIFDTDTGVGSGSFYAFNNGYEIDTVMNIPFGNLSQGPHTLISRVQDSLGNWSLAVSDSFFIGNCTTFWPEITSSDTTTFCEGDSVTLSVNSAYNSYLWSNGSAGSSTTVSLSGTYTVTVVDTAGCSGTSIPIDITVIPNPQSVINALEGLSFCTGDSLLLETIESHQSYLWSTGETTSGIYVSQGGNYSVMVSNGGNCSNSSDPITVSELPTPATPTIIALGGDSLESNVIGGLYRWYVNDSLIEINAKTIEAPVSGIYRVTVVSDECESELSAPFEYWLTNLESFGSDFLIRLYPNPFNDIVYFEIEGESINKVNYELYDIIGKLWQNGELILSPGGSPHINLRHIPAGAYMIRFYDQKLKLNESFRLIKIE